MSFPGVALLAALGAGAAPVHGRRLGPEADLRPPGRGDNGLRLTEAQIAAGARLRHKHPSVDVHAHPGRFFLRGTSRGRTPRRRAMGAPFEAKALADDGAGPRHRRALQLRLRRGPAGADQDRRPGRGARVRAGRGLGRLPPPDRGAEGPGRHAARRRRAATAATSAARSPRTARPRLRRRGRRLHRGPAGARSPRRTATACARSPSSTITPTRSATRRPRRRASPA